MFRIYSKYRTKDSSYINTLKLIQDLLRERMRPEYDNIWIQGSSVGDDVLKFTLWSQGRYIIRFYDVGKLRFFNLDGNILEEIKKIEDLINNIRRETLKDII